MALPWPFREPTGSQHAARYEGKEIKENTKGNALPNAPLFPLPLPTQKGRKMNYRNLAEAELKLRIAEQFFPTYGLCLPHRQDRFYRR